MGSSTVNGNQWGIKKNFLLAFIFVVILMSGCSLLPTAVESTATPDIGLTQAAEAALQQTQTAEIQLQAAETEAAYQAETQAAEMALQQTQTAETSLLETQIAANPEMALYYQAQHWELKFSDTFSSPDWTVGEEEDALGKYSFSYENDEYVMSMQASQGGLKWVSSPSLGDLTNFYASVEMHVVQSGFGGDSCGFVLRAQDGAYYRYHLNRAGFLRLNYSVGNDWGQLFFEEQHGLDTGATTELEIIAEGDHFQIFMNGEFVSEMTNARITSPGQIGLSVDAAGGSGITCAFDNFEVRSNE